VAPPGIHFTSAVSTRAVAAGRVAEERAGDTRHHNESVRLDDGHAAASRVIQSLPCGILSGAVPAKKMGLYMGIFNFFIVIPQILAASVLGILVRVDDRERR
jgi:hypothetical protein